MNSRKFVTARFFANALKAIKYSCHGKFSMLLADLLTALQFKERFLKKQKKKQLPNAEVFPQLQVETGLRHCTKNNAITHFPLKIIFNVKF